ncbi:MAG: hypothetical protein AB8I69_10785 [Anaerolineae bacterium]
MNDSSKWIIYALIPCAVLFLSVQQVRSAGFYHGEMSISVAAVPLP